MHRVDGVNRRARAQVHIVRYGLDRDLSRRRAESLLLYLGAGALTMRVPVGALADRCGRSRVYSGVCLSYAVALVCTCVKSIPTPSTRRSHGKNIASMAWKLYAIEQTQS